MNRPWHLLKALLINWILGRGKVIWIVVFIFLIHGVEKKEKACFHTTVFNYKKNLVVCLKKKKKLTVLFRVEKK